MKNSTKVLRFAVAVAVVLGATLFSGFRSSVNAVRVKWSTSVVRTGKGQADIHFTAEIPGGWRMYSQSMQGQDGALATDIEFDPNPQYSVVGSPRETGKKTSFFQPELGIEVQCLEEQAHYVQHIKYKEGDTFSVKCMVDYMLNRDGEILAPDDEDFTITIAP
jgi:hypothetical protein